MQTSTAPQAATCAAGLEWARALEATISENLDRVPCLELIPENFFYGKGAAFLERLGAAGVPVMVHGVEISIGTAQPLKEGHLEQILRIADRVNAVNISDHLCMTEAGGVEIGQLTPLPFTVAAADAVCRNVEQIQRRISLPFLIENIANRFLVPDGDLTEPEFINLILRRTGCRLLLDLHNLHANAENFGFDPFDWLDALDLERVGAIHLAGGHYDDEGALVDSHSRPVPPRVWSLYAETVRRVSPEYTIVERTDDDPDFEDIMREVERARAMVEYGQFSRLHASATPASQEERSAP